ncbi:hypothetical protein [Funiculus sociatus]|uniref:hypothetical protein n=1 Tax=Funiculus sociatus TaxID=450527 RepID=UPI003298A4F5
MNQRYGCIAGYADKTYLGNRVLSRYEFTAGLNACLNTINQQMRMLLELSLEDIATLKHGDIFVSTIMILFYFSTISISPHVG